MEKLMIGHSGEMGAGKGTATDFEKEWYPGTESFRFSDPLREFWTLWNEHCTAHYGFVFPEKASTPDLQRMSTLVRQLYGENSLERAIAARVERSTSQSPIVIIEGIRRLIDISTFLGLRNTPASSADTRPNIWGRFYGMFCLPRSSAPSPYRFLHIYIEADPKVRWERHRARNEKPGDAELTYEQFLLLGNAEAEQQIRLLKPHAHLVIDNSGPPEAMKRTLRKEINKWLAA